MLLSIGCNDDTQPDADTASVDPPATPETASQATAAATAEPDGKPTTDPPHAFEVAPPPAGLPKTFTDRVLGYEKTDVPFEMVLVPGDASREIEPFYIGKTEVSRAMFLRWAYGDDLDDHEAFHSLVEQDLRPTVIFGEHPAVHVARGTVDWLDYPALGMSWRTAQAYCGWLSEQTGKTYRLPTDDEWMHACRLAGGLPDDREQLLARARLADNAPYDQYEYFRQPRRTDEGTPDRLGLVNLLGNAAEWVQPTDEAKWVRGGHFNLPADELTPDWRGVEDQDVWNAHYPQLPVSRFWYLDYFHTGLRLVCELKSVPTD
ncbi:MAG: formylglycine-generating enzyme family protein [Phycisphaeraceae bacterium]